MYYILLTLLVTLYTLQSLFCKLFSDAHSKHHAYTSGVFTPINCLGIALITFIFNKFSFSFSWTTFYLACLTGIMLILYNISLIGSTSTGPYSIAILFMLSGSIIMPFLFNLIFRHEMLTVMQLCGFVLILSSIFITNVQKKEKKVLNKKFYLWSILLFLSNGFFGILMDLQQSILQGKERNEMIILSYGICALVMFVVNYLKYKTSYLDAFKAPLRTYRWVIFSILIATTAVNLFLHVISISPSTSVLFAVNNGGVIILSMLFSYLLFKEKFTLKKWIGLIVCCLGIVLIS